MKKKLSLRNVLVMAISLGLLLPAIFGGWQNLHQQRLDLTARLHDDQARLSAILANALSHSIWNIDVPTIRLLLDSAAEDTRVVSIRIYGAPGNAADSGVALPSFSQPQRQHGQLLSIKRPIRYQSQQFGMLSVEMDTGQLETQLAQEFRRFLLTTAMQLALSLGFIFVVLDLRFVRPLKRLLADSARLARRELEHSFNWTRSDELGDLGNTLESTRLALRSAFSELQESEQRYRSLTSMSSDWYWERDKSDRLTLLSAGFEEFSGIPPSSLLGAKSVEQLNFDYVPDQWDDYRYCVENRLPFQRLEWKMTRPDGKLRYGATRGEPIFDKNGEFCGYRGIGKDITSEKLAEKAQRSTVRLRQMVEHLPAGALYIEEGKALLNRAAEQITGFTRDEIPDLAAWFEKIYREDPVKARKLYEADKRAGFAVPRERELRRKDGCLRLVEFSAFSDAYCEVWLMHDVTQRKQFEISLAQTLKEQNAIFNNTVAGIEYLIDRVIVRCNRSFEEMLGYEPGELLGKSTRIYYASDNDWNEHGRLSFGNGPGNEIVSSEWQYRKKDGRMIWCSANGKWIDPQDPGKGAIVVTQNINDKKLAEAAFQQAFMEQQIVFENASAGIVLLKDGYISRCNQCLEQMFGYGPGELIGRSARLMYPTDEAYQHYTQQASALIADGHAWSGEWETLRKDGSPFWCAMQGKLIDSGDAAKGTIWIANDTSARKMTEAALVETKNQLERSLIDIEKTHREVMLLSELSSFMQACPSLPEAFAGLVEFVPRLFPGSAGAVYLMDEEEDFLCERANWGDPGLADQVFSSNECWALRRGQPYRMEHPVAALCCPHVSSKGEHRFPYTCLPLIAQGETFGLLFVEHRSETAAGQLEMRHRLNVALSEQAALALANIRLRDTLRRQSMRDPLTGLYNRRHMNEALRRELVQAQRNDAELGLAILDVDCFKQFNDTYGHDAGDFLLQSVASLLLEYMEGGDMVYRFGGGEFVLIFPATAAATAMQRLEQMLKAIRALPLRHAERALGGITASLGLAYFPADGDSSDALLDAAGQALWRAKERGRDRIAVSEAGSLVRKG